MFVARLIAVTLLGLATAQLASAQLKDARLADYEQWRLAQKSGAVADPATVSTLPGFKIDLVRIARPEEGSWISLAFDPRGRAVIGREDKGLLRLSLAEDRSSVKQVESIEETLLECRGLLFAHNSLYVHANNSKGLYRLRDTDGDDRFDEVRLLRKTEGGVGHGRNGLALGRDGMIYLAMGNNVQVPADRDAASPYRNYANDRLLPCAWNEFLFDSDVVPPCGHIVRTDAEGKSWELFAGGFRNPYGLAFNRDGELFTYDADMEWDAGAPWYRPTCVMHVVSGGEYGWRQETNCWPAHYADSLPRAVDIGLGSPTGVRSGERSNYPGKYKEALYVLDWAYGRIIAVHLQPQGASYSGSAETFIKGRPLNVTDLDFGPDGAMYFVVGGRRTQSALYRVSCQKPAEVPSEAGPPPDTNSARARELRQRLAREHGTSPPDALALAWSNLNSGDPWIRQAARVIVEHQPVESWQERALAEEQPTAAGTALLALARSAKPDMGPRFWNRATEIARKLLDEQQRLIVWRAMQLAILRWGEPDLSRKRDVANLLGMHFSRDASGAEREILCELLVALDAPSVVSATLKLLAAAETQEEQLFYIFALRNVERGWTTAQREQYFNSLKRAEDFRGAQYLQRFVTFIRTDALGVLSEEHRKELAPLLATLGKSAAAGAVEGLTTQRPEVRKWTLADLEASLDEVGPSRDLVRGRRLFSEARCERCHRKESFGQPIGPDLDHVASRFGRRDLLESLIVPSKVVEEKYRNLIIETDAGTILTGQLAGGDALSLAIAADPLEPTNLQRVPRKSIVARKTSPISIMPEGLLNPLTREEILDLLAYLEQSSPGK